MKWDRASGSVIQDDTGKSYIDFSSGVIVANAGHGNPQIIKSILSCLRKPLLHCYKYPFAEKTYLEKELLKFAHNDFSTVHFGVSGTEIIETSLRICERHSDRPFIISFKNGFHGKSLGAASIGGIERYKYHRFGKGMKWNQLLDFPSDVKTASKLMKQLRRLEGRISGIFLECVQGSSLERIDKDFLMEVRDWCSRNDTLLIFDEIQTGFYRLGEKFCYLEYDVKPDILCLGKGLTSSLPLSAMLLNGKISRYLNPNLDSSTHAANPLSISSALACLNFYGSESFVNGLKRNTSVFVGEMTRLQSRLIDGVTLRFYRGLFGGIVFDLNAVPVVNAGKFVDICLKKGLFLSGPIGQFMNIVKFTPPLIIKPREIKRALYIINSVLQYLGLIREKDRDIKNVNES